jgi:hypothetical protein
VGEGVEDGCEIFFTPFTPYPAIPRNIPQLVISNAPARIARRRIEQMEERIGRLFSEPKIGASAGCDRAQIANITPKG